MHRILAAMLLSAALPAAATEIVAHRGASHDAPENTLASVKLGWKQRADGVEIDVYLTKDGQVVVFHDKTTQRIGGRDRDVADQTLAELRQLDAGGWKAEKYRGEPIPLLADILKTIPADKRLFIEIKSEAEILPEMKRVLEAAGTTAGQAAIIGFDYDTMLAAKKTFPDRQVYWISSLKAGRDGGRSPGRDELIAKAKAGGLDGLDLRAKPVIDPEYVRAVHDAGLKLYVWTVDDPAEAARLAAAGIDGITTNRPGFLRERLGRDDAGR